MEAKSEGGECRWTYEVSKVLQDKRKGTSVVGGNVHSSCDASFDEWRFNIRIGVFQHQNESMCFSTLKLSF